MDALWELGPATVSQVCSAIGKPPLAYTTVLTTLAVLQKKGYVRRRTEGKAHVFEALVQRDTVERSAIGAFVQTFFRNSKTALALKLMRQSALTNAEIATMRKLIDESEAEDPE